MADPKSHTIDLRRAQGKFLEGVLGKMLLPEERAKFHLDLLQVAEAMDQVVVAIYGQQALPRCPHCEGDLTAPPSNAEDEEPPLEQPR